MKKVIIITGAVMLVVLLGYLAAAPQGADDRVAETVTESAAATARVSIPVEGMTCSACAAGVRSTLARLEGVTNVEVDLAGRKADVAYIESDVRPDELVAAINNLGYKAGKPEARS